MYTCVCVCIYIYIYTYTYIHTYIYVYMHIYMYVRICMYTCIQSSPFGGLVTRDSFCVYYKLLCVYYVFSKSLCMLWARSQLGRIMVMWCFFCCKKCIHCVHACERRACVIVYVCHFSTVGARTSRMVWEGHWPSLG